MMRLSTMWSVDRTLRGDGGSAVADELLQAWRHDEGSARFFRSSANFVYAFRREGEPCFLRFAHDSERTRRSIETEMELLAWLARQGAHAAAPIVSDDGQLVVTSATALGLLHAVVFRAERGVQLEPSDLDESHIRTWGSSLGRLHAALTAYASEHRPVRRSVDDDLLLVEAHLPDAETLRGELEYVRSSLATRPRDATSYGLIHGDYQLDNLFWNGELRAIDFDDCCYHWYLADVALALDDVSMDARTLRPFLDGYEEARDAQEEPVAALELFRRAGELIRYAKVRRALDISPGPHHPQWLRELTDKLRLHLVSYERRISRS